MLKDKPLSLTKLNESKIFYDKSRILSSYILEPFYIEYNFYNDIRMKTIICIDNIKAVDVRFTIYILDSN